MTGLPGPKGALANRWGRMSPILSLFIAKVVLATANHRSDASAEDDLAQVVLLYNADEKRPGSAPFSLMKEYEIIAVAPKWICDHLANKEQADRGAGLLSTDPIRR